MVDLLNRIVKLEQKLNDHQCICRSKNITIRFANDPAPEEPAEQYPVHGRREIIVEFASPANELTTQV